ncbi:uncharacterized protein LOC143668776 [Tamandua tetradactyla]|uniref:uncharacterized protein LOC143668776 n=1 Tax=Tamandua tetradactyla TaxID=48850 RepID=UPI004053ECED
MCRERPSAAPPRGRDGARGGTSSSPRRVTRAGGCPGRRYFLIAPGSQRLRGGRARGWVDALPWRMSRALGRRERERRGTRGGDTAPVATRRRLPPPHGRQMLTSPGGRCSCPTAPADPLPLRRLITQRPSTRLRRGAGATGRWSVKPGRGTRTAPSRTTTPRVHRDSPPRRPPLLAALPWDLSRPSPPLDAGWCSRKPRARPPPARCQSPSVTSAVTLYTTSWGLKP